MATVADTRGGLETAPITEDDAFIARALEDAHLPSLMAALVHVTGDRTHVELDTPLVYEMGGDGQGGLSDETRAEVRARALSALSALREGAALPPPPDLATVRRMLDFITGRELPATYAPFLLDELGLSAEDGTDAVAARLAEVAQGKPPLRVVIIGAGMSGILAAHRLRQAGIEHVVLEKSQDVGGTWLDNDYPGCRVDSSNHSYCYSFALRHDWPHYYSRQRVLLDYFRDCADRFGVRDAIRFGMEVEEAAFDETACLWRVTARGPDGQRETFETNAVISAVGQLNRPRYPDIPGLDRFEGVAFHSARWRHDVDLAGKRVAVIGTGASAFQFVPEIAPEVADLRVFQRSAPWLLPTPNYHAEVPAGMQWLLAHVPFYARWFRFFHFWQSSEGLLAAVRADPDWRGSPRSVGAANDFVRELATGFIRAQVADRPGLAAAVVPDYPIGGKRMLRDNGVWIAALKRDNVHLVTDAIAEVTPRGVVTADGEEHAVDVLIYGTGFQASRFLSPMTIRGRGGVTLEEHWAGDARAYLGITVPGFPNLFCIYGPNTNIVVNGSIIFFSECAMHHVLQCLCRIVDRSGEGRRHGSLECRAEVHDAFNAWVDAENGKMAWGRGVRSWYVNDRGRVSQNWPGSLLDYWRRTREASEADYDVQP